MKLNEILFEMANLSPKETGLNFTVFVSPRGKAKHDVRVKVTNPPWGSQPEAIYGLRPFKLITGKHWLTTGQELSLHQWIDLNLTVLVDFWEGRIIYDDDLKQKLIGIGDAPPADYRQAIGILRASAPKVIQIRWFDNAYHLLFDTFTPNHTKIVNRLQQIGFIHSIVFHTIDPDQGMILWTV